MTHSLVCRVFAGAVADGGIVKAIRVPDGVRISNSRVKPKGDVCNEAVAGGAAGLAYVRVLEGGAIDAAKPIKEGLTGEPLAQLLEACGAQTVGGQQFFFLRGIEDFGPFWSNFCEVFEEFLQYKTLF